MDIASPHTPGTRPAAETFAAIFVVLQSVRGDTRAIGGDEAAHLLQRLAKHQLRRGEFVRTLKEAVGKLRQTFLDTGDAKIRVDPIIVGFQVLISERPVFTVPIAGRGLEI